MSTERKISVTGLGYVGLPVAVAFGRISKVIAFDINEARVAALSRGEDSTGEVSPGELAKTDLLLTTNPEDIAQADFHIVTVPTPIDGTNRPDLSPLISASKTVGKYLKKGDIVVYESTVYPGATEEDCVPVLEAQSGLKCGIDFTVGYSPERINPGDKEHRFETITKVVSGQDGPTLEIVAAVYESVVKVGVHRAPSIKVAEAAKVIENTQRDLNIALMNELSLIFNKMDIDTHDVLAAAGTKWNFLPFTPGLVGGHCIGVDPYYLTHRAEQFGYHPEVILAGRRINDSVGAHIANETVKMLENGGTLNRRVKVTVLGITFKENVPDLRNTKVIDIVRELEKSGIDVQVHDPVADADEASKVLNIDLISRDKLAKADAVIFAVSHVSFIKEGVGLVSGLLVDGQGVVMDIKGSLDPATVPEKIRLWRM